MFDSAFGSSPNMNTNREQGTGKRERGSHRVVFIDLARALAVVFMLYGHTVAALLAPRYQTGTWFDVWLFQRGLTSSLFLLLSGFAFSVATTRHWASHTRPSAAVFKRARRFALLILLGYGLHFPVPRFVLLPSATDVQWRALIGVDVLQLIGVTLLGVQALVMLSRSRRVFTGVALLLAAAAVAITPWAWAVDWTRLMTPALAAYLSPANGSLFPLVPWSAFLLLGASLGQLYARWDAARLTRYANLVLLLPGGLMLLAGVSERLWAQAWFGDGPGGFSPPQFLIRSGACLLLLSGLAHASRRIQHLPHVFGAVAQETLLIYFVHLCIVYGSVWNPGLYQAFGPTLGPGAVFLCVVLLMATMTALAWYWNGAKHLRPRVTRWISVGAMTALIVWLL
jgi:uncharacterized membrane protein